METKTDRELLELAAKTAGYTYPSNDDDIWRHVPTGELHQWNPRTDDGDRYKLIKKLEMRIDFENKTVSAWPCGIGYIDETWRDEPDEVLAVLRLAARIGESK